VRAHDKRTIPVVAKGRFASRRRRLYSHPLAGPFVEPADHAILQLSINRVRVFGIDLGPKSVAALSNKPVSVYNSRSAPGPRRTAYAVVVLKPAVHVIKGRGIVGRHVIELSDRQVRLELPVPCPVPTLINTTIAAYPVVIGVFWIDPDHVIVNVLGLFAQRPESPPTVIGHLDQHVHNVDPIYVFWISNFLTVLHRAGIKWIASFPARSPIARAINPASTICRFDRRVYNRRVNR